MSNTSKTDVLVIGGSAAGFVAAMTVKSNNPDKNVIMIRQEEKVMIPCGIPYIFGELGSSDMNIFPDAGLESNNIEIKVDTVTSINVKEKKCATKKGDSISFDKLIIATGSKPFVPKGLDGANLGGAYTIPKDKIYLDKMMQETKEAKKIAVIGAGFIGVEISDEFKKAGKEVVLIEVMDNILDTAFDPEFAIEAEETLKKRGVNVRTSTNVKKILGNTKVTGILFDDDTSIDIDAVILSTGYRPNVELAENIGLKLNDYGFIDVDQYMRTSIDDILAIGDCASKTDFATGRINTVMLASTACAEARVAALNLYHLSTLKTFNGTIGIYSTNIGELSLGVAGLTEKYAIENGFDIVSGSFTGIDRHPGKISGAYKQRVKLVVSRENGLILGGEVSGGISVGELVNSLGFIIQSHMTITDLLVAQIGTQPMLTASPAAYPLIKAAEEAAKKIRK